jgi:hypothetical protein
MLELRLRFWSAPFAVVPVKITVRLKEQPRR